MKIKELYVFGDMYENIETEDDIKECIENGNILKIIYQNTIININPSYIVSWIL